MKLCTILTALLTFLNGASGEIMPSFGKIGPAMKNSGNVIPGVREDSNSRDWGNFGQLSKKMLPGLALSRRLRVLVEHEMFCENLRRGANYMFDVEVDGEKQPREEVPPQTISAMQSRCQAIRGISGLGPIVMKLRADVVEQNSGNIIMRNDVSISNGVGAHGPLFSTFTMSLLFLALFPSLM